MKTIDPEYARLRLRLSLRKAEQLLSAKKREAADALLAELAARSEDLGQDVAAYVLALQWAAAPPAVAADLLALQLTRPAPTQHANRGCTKAPNHLNPTQITLLQSAITPIHPHPRSDKSHPRSL